MCQSICSGAISRRAFGASAMLGLGALPFAARAAADINALAVMCIDYRLVDNAVGFFDGRLTPKQYDLVALAGASLAAVGPAFPASNAAFWDHVSIAQQLHNVKRVVILDHRDCGAYKVQYGSYYAGSGTPELEQHRHIMRQTAAEFERRKIALAVEFFLMAVDGSVERVMPQNVDSGPAVR